MGNALVYVRVYAGWEHHTTLIDAFQLLQIQLLIDIACRIQTCKIMGWLRPKQRDSDTSRRRRFRKGATKVVEILHYKTDGSLKKGNIQNLSDTKLIKKQHLTRTSVASSVTGVSAGIVASVACPVAAVGVGISAYTMAVSCINRHRVRKEVKRRAMSDANFAKILHEQDRKREKAFDIAVGVTVRGALAVATMGIVGFDTMGHNFADLGSAAVEGANVTTDATSNTAVQAASHGATHVASYGAHHVASHAAAHAAGGGNDPPDAPNPTANHATNHQHFMDKHPHAAALDASFHKVTSGIADKTAEAIIGHTGLQFNGDSGLHQMQQVWHEHDGDAGAKLIFLGQAAVDGGVAEIVQPLQHGIEYGVEKARSLRWKWKANRYEKLRDM